jgi:hypothetical protein
VSEFIFHDSTQFLSNLSPNALSLYERRLHSRSKKAENAGLFALLFLSGGHALLPAAPSSQATNF